MNCVTSTYSTIQYNKVTFIPQTFVNIFELNHNLPSRIALSKSLLGSKAGAGGLAGLLRTVFSVLGGDCFGGDVDIIYKCKTK
jgi:hypothetical protein